MDADVVIGWDFSPLPDEVLKSFQRPTVFLPLPTPPGMSYASQMASLGPLPVQSILRAMAPEVRPLRVATFGYSQSCQGTQALLASADGSRLDAVLCFDGIQTAYAPPGKSSGALVPAFLAPYVAFGHKAVQERRLFVITTGALPPRNFVSTADTSHWIWREVTGGEGHVENGFFPPAITHPDLYPPYLLRTSGGFRVANFNSVDHRLQSTLLLPSFLSAYLVSRWNHNEPRSGVCLVSS